MTYEEYMYKADLCTLTAMKSETDWAYWYWKTAGENLRLKALDLPLDEIMTALNKRKGE